MMLCVFEIAQMFFQFIEGDIDFVDNLLFFRNLHKSIIFRIFASLNHIKSYSLIQRDLFLLVEAQLYLLLKLLVAHDPLMCFLSPFTKFRGELFKCFPVYQDIVSLIIYLSGLL